MKASFFPAVPAVTEVVVTHQGAPAAVALYLSVEEAQTLMMIADNTSGSPDGSRRKHMDNLIHVLREAGVERFPLQPGDPGYYQRIMKCWLYFHAEQGI
jgi:hypothetical protein